MLVVVQASFRPLSWGLSFNEWDYYNSSHPHRVFVPFLGDFLSIRHCAVHLSRTWSRFRPLSWGLSFNSLRLQAVIPSNLTVFVPFLGDFLSMVCFQSALLIPWTCSFRPLSWGLSFNSNRSRPSDDSRTVFVPFLGDFLSISPQCLRKRNSKYGFRPLSWGLSFNQVCLSSSQLVKVFVPFLGDFLSIIEAL